MKSLGTKIKNRVLRRVYLIYFLRQVFRPSFVRIYILLALLWQASVRVSLGSVVKNAPSIQEPYNVYSFVSSALASTEAIIQILSAGVSVLIVWLIVDFSRPFFQDRGKAVA